MKNKLMLMLGIVLLVLVSSAFVSALTYTSQYPLAHTDDYVKSTSKLNTLYWPYFATDPALSLIGSYENNSWLSVDGTITNQRFHIDLGSAKYIRRIYYENQHNSGAETNRGVNSFTFWGSNTGGGTFDDLVWGNDGGWTELTVAQNTFDEHTGLDQADPKYINVTNEVAYRYYAFKFADGHGGASYMGVRHIVLQTEDGWSAGEAPTIIASATTPDPALPNQDWQINITAVSSNISGYIYPELGTEDTAVRGAHFKGQTFTPTVSENITSFTVKVWKAGSPPDLKVELWATDSYNPTSKLYSFNDVPSGEVSGSSPGTWVTSTGSYAVTAGNLYALIFTCPGGDDSNKYNLRVDSGAEYADGNYTESSNSGSSWNTYTVNDMLFGFQRVGLTAYTQFYINSTISGSEISLGISNNINTLIATLAHANFSDGALLTAEVWVGDRELNSTKANITALADVTYPTITTDGIDLNLIFVYINQNLTGQINASDENLYSINISIDSTSIFNTSGYDSDLYIYNLSQNVSSFGAGLHNLSIRACDGHTNIMLKDEWEYDIGLSGLTFKDGNKWYRINPNNNDIFESISTTKLSDRYTFEYSKSAIGKLLSGDTYTFVVESSEYIDIINRPNSKYNAWMIIPSMERWIDFNLKGVPDAKYVITRLNDKQVKVEISNIPKDIKELVFESTGELNCVTEYYEFYVFNYTLTHDLTVLETSVQPFVLTITNNPDFIDYANATLNWNGTAYTPSNVTTNDYITFTQNITMPSIDADSYFLFNWSFNVTGNNNITVNINTSNFNQTVYSINFNDCSVYDVVALNFSLIEESNNASIAGDMDFTFTLVGEAVTLNYSKSVTGVNSTRFCISTNEVNFTAQLHSEYTAGSYASHTYFAYDLTVNNEVQYILYYLTNGTTIVEFTVLDQSGNKLENAYIKVMKYDIGTGLYKTTEVLKTDELGKALGNIVLDTAWYKFMIEYQGTLYLDTSATKLTSTKRTFTINLLSDFFDRFTDVIYNIYSTLNYTDATGNFAFTYSDPNGNYHRGCLLVTKESLGGQTVIEEKCVESTAWTILVNVNSSGSINGTYTAVGYIMFDDKYVLRTLSMTWGHLSDVYGKEGLFYVFLIVLTCVMTAIFSPKLAIILAVIGLVFTNILGFIFIELGWLVVIIIAAGLTVYRMRDM